ncbi:hypothetical protein ACVIU7_007622 [Bradyrhizobium liaoningense]
MTRHLSWLLERSRSADIEMRTGFLSRSIRAQAASFVADSICQLTTSLARSSVVKPP